MQISYVLLVFLFIISLFNIGEKIYNKLNVNHFFVAGGLLLSLVCLSIPDILLNNISFSVVGFIFPLFLTLKLLPKILNKNSFIKCLIGVLLCAFALLIYNLLNIKNLQFFLAYSLLLGCLLFILTKSTSLSFISLFLGLNVGEFILFKMQGELDSALFFGGEQVFSMLLLSIIFCLIASVLQESFLQRKSVKQQKRINVLIEK